MHKIHPARMRESRFALALALRDGDAHATACAGYDLNQVGRQNALKPKALHYWHKDESKSKGVVQAGYAVRMLYSILGDQRLAFENLQACHKAVPKDASAGKPIEAVRAGKVEINRAGVR